MLHNKLAPFYLISPPSVQDRAQGIARAHINPPNFRLVTRPRQSSIDASDDPVCVSILPQVYHIILPP